MKLKLRPLIILSLLLATRGQAAELAFTIESAVRHALTTNADLAAARLSVAEATSRVEQAGRWSNPELETEIKPNIRGREGSFSAGFTQRFPLASRLKLEKGLSRTHVAIAEAEVHEFERKLALEVRTVAVQIAALDAHIALKPKQLQNIGDLAAASRKAAGAGEGSDLETAQLELESAQLTAQRLQAEADQAELKGHLRLLLALSAGTGVRVEDSLDDPKLAAAEVVDVAKRGDYLAATARTAAANQSIEVARASRWEDARVGLFGEVDRTEDVPVGIRTEGMVGLRLSLPLPLWNTEKGRVAEASATANRRQKEADALAHRIHSEASIARGQMEAAAARAKSIADDLLPKARLLEERLTRRHAEGQAPMADLLRARERRLQFDASAIDARRDFHLARVRHLAATGQTPSIQP